MDIIPKEIFEQSIKRYMKPVVAYLEDDSISEVMINGAHDVWIEIAGKLQKTEAKWDNPDDLMGGVKNIAQYVGKPLDQLNPRLDARLPDGSRVHVVLPPCSRNGVVVCIRRFGKFSLTPQKLLDYGSVSPEALEFINLCIQIGKNMMVAGGTGSGKTSLLNTVSTMVDPMERIIVIEDSTELQLQQPHVIMMEARPPDAKGRGRITIGDLFKSAMRLRPDRVIIGEIRGGEALDMIQAMTSGHGGSLSTCHATYPADTLRRMETMALMNEIELPLKALRSQIASAINLIIQTSRFNDGSRKLTYIYEALGLDEGGEYVLYPLFEYHQRGTDKRTGKVLGSLDPVGNLPTFAEHAKERGLHYDEAWFKVRN